MTLKWDSFVEPEIRHPEDIDEEINRPPHYNVGSIEVYDFIRDQQLPYPMGAIIKYICRCRWKGQLLKDLKKARWYIDRCIEEAEAGEWTEDRERERSRVCNNPVSGSDCKCGEAAIDHTGYDRELRYVYDKEV